MERLKRFEEECQGLFDNLLDLSPPAQRKKKGRKIMVLGPIQEWLVSGAFRTTVKPKRSIDNASSAPSPPAPETPSAFRSGEVTGVHLTPESPAAHSSVRLAPILIWLVLPVFVVSLAIDILRRTTSPPS
jgi:hypothetical protein